ncbi:hypothetical protein AMTRI_Chr07g78040 [Amborella trichopoda]
MTRYLLAPLGSPGMGLNSTCIDDRSWNFRGLGDSRKKSALIRLWGLPNPTSFLVPSFGAWWFLRWPFNPYVVLFENF